MHKRIVFFVKLLCLTFLIGTARAQEPQQESQPLFDFIAQENLKTLTAIDAGQNNLSAVTGDMEEEGFGKVALNKFNEQINPDPMARRRLALELLADYEKANNLPINTVLDTGSMCDLELLCGPKSNNGAYLAGRLARTQTECGRMMLYRRLINPTDDIEALMVQQKTVKELVYNEKLFNDLQHELASLKKPENALLSLWDSEDLFSFVVDQMKFCVPGWSKFRPIKSLNHWLNTSPIINESYLFLDHAFEHSLDALAAYATIALPVYMLTGKSIIPFLPAQDFNKVEILSFAGVAAWIASRASHAHVIPNIIATLHHAYHVHHAAREYKTHTLFSECLHAKIRYIAQYLNTAQKLTKIVEHEQDFIKNFPAANQFKNMLEKIKSKNTELAFIFELLSSKSATGPYSTWLLNWGKLWVVYRLLLIHKDDLMSAVSAVGEIDAQLGIARLYKEFQGKPITFCFPKFLEKQDGPAIRAINFWNPFIETKKVVPSSLELGNTYQNPANAIITGPNAGGKSTITKAFIMSALLAQSIGIVPAQNFQITPFTKIITYLNIVDDIAAANSHFKAGVVRAKEVVDTLGNLASHTWGLTAIDEVFNGTTFIEGQAAAYCLFKQLGQNPKSMCVTCTHFPMVPTLETSAKTFDNYHVSVLENPDGTISYPFLLERGISNQIVTLKILHNEGFDAKFLHEAQQLVEEQKNHKPGILGS